MKSSQKDFPRISKTLLTKDNKTHLYWSVLQPSTPFHTLVKLVFAEDIANDKIRTHDLALEVNNITQQLQTQTLDSSQQVELLCTQPRDPNNKNKPAYKKFCSYCQRTNHSISACFKKQRDDEDNRDAYARSISPQISFVQYFRSPSNDRTQRYDTRYRSGSTPRNNYYNEKKNNSQNRYRPTSRDRFSYDKRTTPPQNTRSRYDNYKRDSRSYRSHYRSSYRSPYRRDYRHRYRSDRIQEITTILQDTHLPTDHLHDRKILDILDPVHIQSQGTNLIQYNHKPKRIQLISKYISITQLKWQTL